MRLTLRRLAHLLVALVGVAAIAWGLTGAGSITCRGVQMHPGDVCVKNDFSQIGSAKTQTYEQRLHAVRLSQPVIVVLGVALLAFGAGLTLADVRKDRRA